MPGMKIHEYVDIENITGLEELLTDNGTEYRKISIEELRNLAADITNTALADLLGKAASAQDVKNILNSVNAQLSDMENKQAIQNGNISNLQSSVAENTNNIANNNTKIASNTNDITSLKSQVSSLASGSPKAVTLVSQMTDTAKNYVYIGSESGYTSGDWYYYNGSAWASGGKYLSDIDYDAINTTTINALPFHQDALLCKTTTNQAMATLLKKSLLDIRLYGANKNDKYYVSYLSRSNDGNNIIVFSICNSQNVVVCEINEWYHYFPKSNVENMILKEKNNSGITGTLKIDWSVFIAGTSVSPATSTLGGYAETGISILNYTDNKDFINILLPSTIYSIINKEFNIYFNNIILCNNLDDYQIDVVCDVGVQQNERFTCTPTATGTHSLTINVYKDYVKLVATATTTLNFLNSTGSSKNKKALLIGDSWTANVFYVAYLRDRFVNGDGDDITLLGTMTNWGSDEIRYEGRAGWNTTNYVSSQSYNGNTNAFYNPSTGKFDFSYYLSNNGISTPDIVTIFLGINDAGNGIALPTTISNINEMITSIHAVSSDIKIGIVLPPPPCQSQDGFGKVNGAANAMFSQKYNAFNVSKVILENFTSVTNVFIIPVMSAVDMLNNVNTESVQVNAYNSKTITRIIDNVHCNEYGYEQVADAFYGAIKALY